MSRYNVSDSVIADWAKKSFNPDANEIFESALTLEKKMEFTFLIPSLLKRKRYYNILDLYEKSIKLDPAYWKPYFGKGGVYGKIKNYQSACDCYKSGLLRNPEIALLWLGVSQAEMQLNHHSAACEAAQRSLTIDANLNHANQIISYCKSFCDDSNYDNYINNISTLLCAYCKTKNISGTIKCKKCNLPLLCVDEVLDITKREIINSGLGALIDMNDPTGISSKLISIGLEGVNKFLEVTGEYRRLHNLE